MPTFLSVFLSLSVKANQASLAVQKRPRGWRHFLPEEMKILRNIDLAM